MGKVYSAIDGKLKTFIEAQQMFFVATVPSSGGHIHLSPKGLNALRILGPNAVACQCEKNDLSSDGLPGLRWPVSQGKP